MASLEGANDMVKLGELSKRSYKEQAQYVLNAFWLEFGQNEKEMVWSYCAKMVELDEKHGKAGCELDELKAHQFLEKFEETLTVREMREVLREIDIDTNTRVSLAEYLIFRYKCDWHALVNSIQGNAEEVAKAKQLMAEAQSGVENARTTSESARKAENESARRQREAVAAESRAAEAEKQALAAQNAAPAAERAAGEARADATAAETSLAEARVVAAAAEDVQKAAEMEVQKAVDELAAEEKAYQDRLADMERRSQTGGLVSRNKAKHELAQAKAEDPLPLRRAKITADAALKRAARATDAAAAERAKVEEKLSEARKQRKLAEVAEQKAIAEARAAESAAERASNDARAAESARKIADAALEEAQRRRNAADIALNEANMKLREAEDFLEKAKKTMPQGTLWWLERELSEQKKYMPQSKGGRAGDEYWKK
eukprot:317991_1